MGALIKKAVITVIIVVLTGWLLNYSWRLRQIKFKKYTFTTEEAKRLRYFAKAQYAHGYQAWIENDAAATAYFKQAIAHDVFYMDAWLKLAQTEVSMGHRNKARAILQHTDRLTAQVLQWKWPQTLLALELGMDEIFLRNINYLIPHHHVTTNTLYLLDTYYSGKVSDVIRALLPNNLEAYLTWLIRWNRLDDTLPVWDTITETGMPDREIIMRYVHFLVTNSHITKAKMIWHTHTGIVGMTNAGFEMEITGRGFDWRRTVRGKNIEIHRVRSSTHKGFYSLQITFLGRENTYFRHLFQIVPVKPLHSYCLTYAWRSREITTDQGPFVEIYGYGHKGLYKKCQMMRGTNAWATNSIEFIPPEGCQAIIVRLKRQPSHRFDRNIAGTLWLDDFILKEVAQVK